MLVIESTLIDSVILSAVVVHEANVHGVEGPLQASVLKASERSTNSIEARGGPSA
jgi:hypothetical protein